MGSSTQEADCCEAKAQCSSASCPAGMKVKTANANLYCSTASGASCSTSTCCENDLTKCSSWSGSCATNRVKKAGQSTLSTSSGNEESTCCEAKTQCSAYTCPAGKIARSGVANTYCSGSASSTCQTSVCCENDPAKCSTWGGSCNPNRIKKANQASVSMGSNSQEADCCEAKAQCSSASCPVGMQVKTANANLYCSTASGTSCSTS